MTFGVTYNTALLTVTGGVVDPSVLGSYPHATFSRTTTGTPVAGIETDIFTFTTGSSATLSIGSSWTLGDISASVPNTPGQLIYKDKQVLTVSNIASDGGSHGGVTNANLVGGNGFEVVAYLGDASGDGNIQLNDATLANIVGNPFIGGGLPAYTMVDPVVVDDTDGAGIVDATTVGNVASLAIGHAQPTIPTPPAGRITASGGADPDLSLPGQITVRDGLLEVPVNLNTAMPVGSSGLTEATLDLTFEAPLLLQVRAASSEVRSDHVSSRGTFLFGNALSINVLPLITPGQLATLEVFSELARQRSGSDGQGLIDDLATWLEVAYPNLPDKIWDNDILQKDSLETPDQVGAVAEGKNLITRSFKGMDSPGPSKRL